MSESFFQRWSRRKQQEREDGLSAEQPAAPVAAPVVQPVPAAADAVPPPPTLADAQALTPESDFKPFLARNVAPEVKNTAFRKLFADPHFNAMDGLDTYIDDYSQSTPIPASALRQMASARFLKLFQEDVAQSEAPADIPSPPVAEASRPPASHDDDHHADLRLQPDDAASAEDNRPGPA